MGGTSLRSEEAFDGGVVVEEVILRAGDPSDALYIVQQGEVVVSKEVAAGQSITLASFIAGDCFGELDFFSRTPRNATAVAEAPAITRDEKISRSVDRVAPPAPLNAAKSCAPWRTPASADMAGWSDESRLSRRGRAG